MRKAAKFKEFRDIKPAQKTRTAYDSMPATGKVLRDTEEDNIGAKNGRKSSVIARRVTIRPTSLKVRIPISIKDLASEMKLKASQLIAKAVFARGDRHLNDLLEDETTIQLLGQEFGCEITIDTSEEERSG